VRTIAIVPVKALAEAKTRLAAVLTQPERAALTLRALRNVLAALDHPGIAARLVVSPDETVLREARALGARGLRQVGGGLNEGLEQARARAIAAGADHLVVGRPILEAPDPNAAAEAIVAEIAGAAQ
jgi:2-phospho-L-lactate guanylyltransferase (CobY/MobA/RfbA family)